MQENSSPNMRPENADTNKQYLLHSQVEIISLLRDAMKRGGLLTTYFDEGMSFFLTSILAVSEKGLILDYGSDDTVNQHALQATKLTCLTNIDRVKVQFVLNGVSEVQHEGRPAFSSPLPDAVLRLQRREYFRVGTPLANPVKCDISIQGADHPDTVLQIPLIDISAGGLGLNATTEQMWFFKPDQVMGNCLLTLHDGTQIAMTLVVRNAFEVTTRAGQRYIRVGCEFHDLRASSLNIIQRYITQLERERKMRYAGIE
ncbi:MAG: flagellar brake protein [Zoogloeaceae bacterium]|jgi:c-di-GMP-binding flagellar brake protein YcgR|nr:flagellar brake protein [Zoogloeaceae bacterium]